MKEYKVKVNDSGTKEWLNLDNQRHREDGPAVEYSDGDKSWWINDQRHREDGPAIEWSNGDKEWWINGQKHCEDGPAIEYANGHKEWWINGQKLTEQEFNKRNNCSGKVVEIDGKNYKLIEL